MSNLESPPQQVSTRRRGSYRPAIVLFVTLAAVMIGVGLKYNTREQRIATIAIEQTSGESPGLAVPR
jgi:hypothetical protein